MKRLICALAALTMKKLVIGVSLTVLFCVALAVGNDAAARGQHDVKARLNGFQEVPSISSTGSGNFRARVDEGAIFYELRYGGLEGTAIQAHVHLGQRSVNGGVSAFLCGGGGKPPCLPSGTVSGVITPSDVVGPTDQGIAPGEYAELIRAMRAGHTYANVHTTKHPGGEIRGQIDNRDQRELDD